MNRVPRRTPAPTPPSPGRHRHIRAPRGLGPIAIALILALVTGACGTSPSELQEYRAGRAENVFEAGYETIYDKYIQPLAVDDFAYRGIENLEEIEPALEISRTGKGVSVTFAGRDLGTFPAPDKEDISGWASLTTQILAAGRIASASLRDTDAERVYQAVFEGALAKLDRHSRYAGVSSARDYRAQREGFGGIGVRLSFDDEQVQIISVLPNTPAASSVLKAGDLIIAVDGGPVAGLPRREVIGRLRGIEGTEVKIDVLRNGDRGPFAVYLRRDKVVPPTVLVSRRGRVGVLDVSSFNQHTARRVVDAVKRFTEGPNRITGLILDLRGNPGGLLDQAVAVADAFVSEGRILSTRGRHRDSYQSFTAKGYDFARDVPIVVLINGQSASAAEIVAAALQDRARAVVVGSNSYGKGTVQNITRLPNDGEMILTWSRFHAPSGYALDLLGVMPTICTNTPQAEDGVGAGTVFETALIEAPALLASWRRAAAKNSEKLAELRARCPKRAEKPEVDFQIAERLLTDSALYARALGASRPDIAQARQATGDDSRSPQTP
jgi:carboxyl-terminal processing protease